MQDNPYAPPKAVVDAPTLAAETAPPLWNPNAAASWCLLFTPIFGSWLHWKNWQALGEEAHARSARMWLIVSIVVVVVSILTAGVLPRGISRLINFGYLIGWYYAAAKPQVRFVLGRYGKDYPRRGWLVPIAIALGVLVAFVLVVGVLLAVAGVEA